LPFLAMPPASGERAAVRRAVCSPVHRSSWPGTSPPAGWATHGAARSARRGVHQPYAARLNRVVHGDHSPDCSCGQVVETGGPI